MRDRFVLKYLPDGVWQEILPEIENGKVNLCDYCGFKDSEMCNECINQTEDTEKAYPSQVTDKG